MTDILSKPSLQTDVPPATKSRLWVKILKLLMIGVILVSSLLAIQSYIIPIFSSSKTLLGHQDPQAVSPISSSLPASYPKKNIPHSQEQTSMGPVLLEKSSVDQPPASLSEPITLDHRTELDELKMHINTLQAQIDNQSSRRFKPLLRRLSLIQIITFLETNPAADVLIEAAQTLFDASSSDQGLWQNWLQERQHLESISSLKEEVATLIHTRSEKISSLNLPLWLESFSHGFSIKPSTHNNSLIDTGVLQDVLKALENHDFDTAVSILKPYTKDAKFYSILKVCQQWQNLQKGLIPLKQYLLLTLIELQ